MSFQRRLLETVLMSFHRRLFETVLMRFVVCICDMYQNLTDWLNALYAYIMPKVTGFTSVWP